MKKIAFLMTTAMLAGMLGVNAAEDKTPAPAAAEQAKPEVKTISPEEMKKRIGYFLGYQSGSQFAQQGPISMEDIDMKSFEEGMKNGLAGQQPTLSENDIRDAFMQFQQVAMKRVGEMGKANMEAGKKFLEENAKKEGVTTTKSGLQYKVINKGGDKKYEAPKDGKDKGDRFVVNYKGTLPNGEVFDKGEGAEFTLDLIPGFREALVMMPVGAKWELAIPSDLAYGEQGAGPKIGPNQTLVFELELKDILPPQENKGQPGQSMTPEQLQELLKQAAEDQAKQAPAPEKK